MSGPDAIWDVRRFEELDSTNRYLLDLARQGAPERVVVVADHQTAGKGRLGRTWEAPAGSALLMSVLFRPSLPPERLHLVTIAVALAAADATAAVAGFRPSLKWPNDLVVDDRKLAGILAEVPEPGAVVVGLGLNLTWLDPPVGLEQSAVAVNQVIGRVVDRDAVLDAVLGRLDQHYRSLSVDSERLVAAYRDACSTIGRHVRVDLGSGAFRGLAVDVTIDGHLVVDDGSVLRTVSAGDVVHVRPAGAGA